MLLLNLLNDVIAAAMFPLPTSAPEEAPARKKKTETLDDMLSKLSPADQELVEVTRCLVAKIPREREGERNRMLEGWSTL